MLLVWKMPRNKSLSLLIFLKKVTNMSKWVPKSQKELFSQDLQVQVRLCLPKHVLDKPEHLSSMFLGHNSYKCLSV